MKRYNGKTGSYEIVPEPDTFLPQTPRQELASESELPRKPSSQSGNLSGLGSILGELGGKSGGGLGDILGGLGDILGGTGGKPDAGDKTTGGLSGLLGGLGGGFGSILGGLGGKQGGGLGGILSKLTTFDFELEDIILVAVLYLLYRESKDIEFLLIAGAMLFL